MVASVNRKHLKFMRGVIFIKKNSHVHKQRKRVEKERRVNSKKHTAILTAIFRFPCHMTIIKTHWLVWFDLFRTLKALFKIDVKLITFQDD